MDFCDKKKWLERATALKKRIKLLESRKEYWSSERDRITANTTEIKTKNGRQGNDYIGKCISKIDSIERKIICHIDNSVDAVREIEKSISRLTDEREKYILTEHYLNGTTFSKIAEDMAYSERHVYNMVRSAINKLRTE